MVQKMIKIKLGTLADLRPALTWVGSLNLKQSDGFRLARALCSIDDFLKTYKEKYDSIIKKYGTTDENGIIGIPNNSPNRGTALQELEELRAVEVDLNMNPIKVSMFANIKRDPKPSDGEAFKKNEQIAIEIPAGAIASLMPLLEWDLED